PRVDLVADIREQVTDGDQIAVFVVEKAGPHLGRTQLSEIEVSNILRLELIVADVELHGVVDRLHAAAPSVLRKRRPRGNQRQRRGTERSPPNPSAYLRHHVRLLARSSERTSTATSL